MRVLAGENAEMGPIRPRHKSVGESRHFIEYSQETQEVDGVLEYLYMYKVGKTNIRFYDSGSFGTIDLGTGGWMPE